MLIFGVDTVTWKRYGIKVTSPCQIMGVENQDTPGRSNIPFAPYPAIRFGKFRSFLTLVLITANFTQVWGNCHYFLSNS